MKYTHLTNELYDYMIKVSLREHPALLALRNDTSKLSQAMMQTGPEQAQFMQFIIRMIGAKNILELGTFTGYSALAMALAMPDDGRLITCDVSQEWTRTALKFWEEAGQDKKIELRLAPALETIAKLLVDGYKSKFDLIFIDADKPNYVDYYQHAMELISPSGVIAIDNVFWAGEVIQKTNNDVQTNEIRRLNTIIQNDDRVDISLLTVADGLFLVRKKS
jgi:predicted O-methyltransferase YrrM